MAKNESLTYLGFAGAVIAFMALIAYLSIDAQGYSTPYFLPQRNLSLPVFEQIENPAGDGKIIYAKEALSFKAPSGTYTVRGYLKASQSLNGAIGVYVRAEDPADDPTCKVLTVPSQTQSGVLEFPVYVCERGQGDARAVVVEFADISFASFCSFDPGTYQVVTQGKFWIGVGWYPLLPHFLVLVFDDLAALKVARFKYHPCAFDYR